MLINRAKDLPISIGAIELPGDRVEYFLVVAGKRVSYSSVVQLNRPGESYKDGAVLALATILDRRLKGVSG